MELVERALEKKRKVDRNWTIKKHKDWADKRNYGVTHFGVHPQLLLRSSIRFDTLHAGKSCAVTIMNRVRLVIREYNEEANKSFE